MKSALVQNSFSQGEIGYYMNGRADNAIYHAGASKLENWVCLPQGGLQRRRGFCFVDLVSVPDTSQVKLANFYVSAASQFALVFVATSVLIYQNDAKVTTLTTPYAGADVRSLRWAQQGNTMVIVHPDYQPAQLQHDPVANTWAFSTISFSHINYYQFNTTQSLTPSATTGSITLTLSQPMTAGTITAGGTGYLVGDLLTISGGTQNIPATFIVTTVSAGGVVTGIKLNVGGQYQTAPSNPASTTGGNGTGCTITLTIGSFPYFTTDHIGVYVRCNWLPNNPPTTPPAGVALITSISAGGNVANADVITTLGSTNPDPAWSEQAWSAAHGYPATVTFFQDKLSFGGTRDAPGTIFCGHTGQPYNFDDSQTNANYAFGFTLSSSQNEIISDIRAYLQGLAIFTTVGEHLLITANGPVTPTNVYIAPQTAFGISNIPVIAIEYQMITVTNNGKEIRSYNYQYYLQRYQTTSLTTISHQLFTNGQAPTSTAYLRDYADTQANYLFVVREDGQMAVCCLDTDKNVLAWSRFTTNGTFIDCAVSRANHGNGYNVDTLYVITSRTNGVCLEYLTEEENYVDCYYTGYNASPKTSWTGLTALENMAVQVWGDGTVQAPQTVSNSGSITIPNPVSNITIGLEYDSLGTTMPFVVSVSGEQLRGMPLTKSRCTVYLYNTQSMMLDGYNVVFRQFGGSLLDHSLPYFTGEYQPPVLLGGTAVVSSPTLSFSVTDPLPCTVLMFYTEVNIGATK